MKMRKYYLFFERPKGSYTWTQTKNAGKDMAYPLINEQNALSLKEHHDAAFPYWQHEIRVVELPAEKAG